MKHCILVTDEQDRTDIATACIVHWEAWDVPEGHCSLPTLLTLDLPLIRAEHARWAWEMGQTTIQGKRLCDWFTLANGLSMWWTSLLYERHPKMTPNLYTIYKLRALERFLEQEGCTQLTLKGGDKRLARTLEHFCSTSSRTFFWQKGRADGSCKLPLLKRLYHQAPADLRVVLRTLHFWWSVKRHLPRADLHPSATKTATITTYFPNVDMKAASQGRFRSRYFENLHDLINHAAQTEGAPFVRWLFIRFPSPHMSLAQCIAFKKSLAAEARDGLSFHYLEEFLSSADFFASLKDFLLLRANSRKLEKTVFSHFHFADSALNFYDYCQEDWIESFRGWRALERTLQARAFMNYVASSGPQRYTLFPLENCPWERMLTYAVHTAKAGPVFGAQHSTVRPTDFRYFDDPKVFGPQTDLPVPDRILGNGRSSISQWQEAGVPKEKLGMVEALRYLYLQEKLPAKIVTQTASAPAFHTLLLLTSFFRDETEAHLRLFVTAYEAGLFNDLPILIKAHPYLAVDPWLPDTLKKRVTIADQALPNYLTSGVLVWASNSTTAALEAAIQGLAVAVMRPTHDFDLSPIQDIPGLVRTATLEDVKTMLASARPCVIPKDYLLLDDSLSRWRALLQER